MYKLLSASSEISSHPAPGASPHFSHGATQPGALEKSPKLDEFPLLATATQEPYNTVISNGGEQRAAPEKIEPWPSVAWCDMVRLMSRMELRRAFRSEANTHRNMLSRRRTQGALVASEFLGFLEFLLLVGPKPTKGATLDRINHLDPEYAPGKVRWADRRTQNNNKSDTILLSCTDTGRTYTVSQLAKLQSTKPGTIRSRLKRGWTDKEAIAGKKLYSSTITHSSKSTTPLRTATPSIIDLGDDLAAFSTPALWNYPPLDFPAGLYTAAQRRRICAPTMDDYRFAQDAYEHQHQRQHGDGERLPMTKAELIRSMIEDGDGHLLGDLKDDGDERRFVGLVTSNSHIYFPNLAEHHRQVLQNHNPQWVEMMERRFQRMETQSAKAAKKALALQAELSIKL